ncbi:hypothetical protein E2C01_091744 [Portunus trituberculatus]|uniref:Uncharacterized protein n=1 Tax=Portunus trituberculatus TaxID=210409 RepID=A0A5B7JJU0_PORTR|nr:hypothetical protein [Portunus trituberculatus]
MRIYRITSSFNQESLEADSPSNQA